MKVEHSMTLVGTCPVDGSTDVYELIVTTSRLIPVEDIIAAAHTATERPAYQEEVAAGIRAHLGGDGVTVRLTGRHSGVETVVTV